MDNWLILQNFYNGLVGAMPDSNHVSRACTQSKKQICSLQRLISSSKSLRVIHKTRLKYRHFYPWMLT
jgi:hypothetical protein